MIPKPRVFGHFQPVAASLTRRGHHPDPPLQGVHRGLYGSQTEAVTGIETGPCGIGLRH
ncbi:MAG: hypothetical protein RL572_408, partial [Pseudomonadota bacterium]